MSGNINPQSIRRLPLIQNSRLLQKPGKVWSRELLLQQVQGYQFNGYDRTIDTHVKNLRKKLATYGLESSIVTVYGIGYRFQLLERSIDE